MVAFLRASAPLRELCFYLYGNYWPKILCQYIQAGGLLKLYTVTQGQFDAPAYA